MKEKKDIRALQLDEIIKFCELNNQPKFKGNQIWQWLWQKRALSFNEMTSLSINFRKTLDNSFLIRPIKIHNSYKSVDGTIKYSFKLYDRHLVEGVLIPSKNRLTACISSQVGCSLACGFCATGTLKLSRNIHASEIYDQAFLLNNEAIQKFNRPISNIVYMGMGEPLLNYNAVLSSINFITSKTGLGMSAKRITVSTAGIAKMIKKLADDRVKFNLAISLHSANDITRSKLMPINEKIDLYKLNESIKYFYQKTRIKATYEYILFKDVNDSLEDAKLLAKFAKNTPCKINLIEYNHVDNLPYSKSSNNMTNSFISYLEKNNIIVTLRKSKGKDIAAACGQLVNKL